MTFYALTHWQPLYFSGKDAQSFLQNLCTSDITKITSDVFQPTTCCNLQGRVVAILWITRTEEGFLALFHASVYEILMKHFKPYLKLARMTLTPGNILDEATQALWVGIENDQIQTLTSSTQCFMPFRACVNLPFSIGQVSQPSDLSAPQKWHQQQMMHLIPDITQETSGLFTPNALGFETKDGIISFNKGCYLGQEIVARLYFKSIKKTQLQYTALSFQEHEETIVDQENLMYLIIKQILS